MADALPTSDAVPSAFTGKDRVLSVEAKPWVPPTSFAKVGSDALPIPTSTSFGVTSGLLPSIAVGGVPIASGHGMPQFPIIASSGAVVGGFPQSMLPFATDPTAAMLALQQQALMMPVQQGLSVQVGVAAPFVPTITSSMPTRTSTRIPRGRGNSGRGLRAQQEMKQKAMAMPPPYAAAVEAEQDEGVASYNPLAPMPLSRRDEDEEGAEAFHAQATLGVLGEDMGPAIIPSAKTTPKITRGGVGSNVIGSAHNTPSAPHVAAMPLVKPTPTFVPAPANSPFHSMLNAKPFVPPSSADGSTSSPASQGGNGITPPANTAPDAEADDEASPLGVKDGIAEALRVDADTFFTEQQDESQVREAAKAFQKNQENPYSITSLQGIRATMPNVEPAPWYPLRCGDEDIFLPAPFRPESGVYPMPEEGVHSSICRPEQYPNAKLSLFYYLCYHCPITCQLAKLNDRPPDLKLGGICGDINPACIAHLVETLSGIKLIALDVFGHNFGRCNLWLRDPQDAPRMMAALDRRVWMSPVPHGYAVVVDDDESREYLLWYLEGLREHGPRRVRFPRHLMTCERWIV